MLHVWRICRYCLLAIFALDAPPTTTGVHLMDCPPPEPAICVEEVKGQPMRVLPCTKAYWCDDKTFIVVKESKQEQDNSDGH